MFKATHAYSAFLFLQRITKEWIVIVPTRPGVSRKQEAYARGAANGLPRLRAGDQMGLTSKWSLVRPLNGVVPFHASVEGALVAMPGRMR